MKKNSIIFYKKIIKSNFLLIKKRQINKFILNMFNVSVKPLKYLMAFILCLSNMFFVLIFIFALFFTFFNPGFNSLMIYRSLNEKQKNQKIVFIPLKNISKKVQAHIVGIEDFRFYDHIGIDPEAILTAYSINKKLGYKHSGGSTITQQLVRTLFLNPEKNYTRKFFEMFIAMEFDLILTKQRILELYINNIEFGKGIYGIGRASLYYYGKPFNQLDPDEINKLITIIPNPRKYSPDNFFYNNQLLTRYTVLTIWNS